MNKNYIKFTDLKWIQTHISINDMIFNNLLLIHVSKSNFTKPQPCKVIASDKTMAGMLTYNHVQGRTKLLVFQNLN